MTSFLRRISEMRFLTRALVFTLCTPFLIGAHTTHTHDPSHSQRHAPFPAPPRIREPIDTPLEAAKIWDFARAGAPPPPLPSRKLPFHGDTPPAGHLPGAAQSDNPRPDQSAKILPLVSLPNPERVPATAGAADSAEAADTVPHDTVPGLPRHPPAVHGGRFLRWLHHLRHLASRLRPDPLASRLHPGPLHAVAPAPPPSGLQRQSHSPPPPHSPTQPPPLSRVSSDAHGPAPTPSLTPVAPDLTLPSPPSSLGARPLGNAPHGPSLSRMYPTPGLPARATPVAVGEQHPLPSPNEPPRSTSIRIPRPCPSTAESPCSTSIRIPRPCPPTAESPRSTSKIRRPCPSTTESPHSTAPARARTPTLHPACLFHLPRQSAQLLSIPLILSSTQLC